MLKTRFYMTLNATTLADAVDEAHKLGYPARITYEPYEEDTEKDDAVNDSVESLNVPVEDENNSTKSWTADVVCIDAPDTDVIGEVHHIENGYCKEISADEIFTDLENLNNSFHDYKYCEINDKGELME